VAARSTRPRDGVGVVLTPLQRTVTDSAIVYPHVRAELDRDSGTVAITVSAPSGPIPANLEEIHEAGADLWSLAVARELDDLVLRLRLQELELGTWVLRTQGDPAAVLAHERLLVAHADDWFVNEVRHQLKRTLKRLDVSSRSLIALIEPGSCFAGPLLELALAADRSYMLDGTREGEEERGHAVLVLGQSNFGLLPMGNGLSRLEGRFLGDGRHVERLRECAGEPLDATAAWALGLVTFTPDDLDWDDEVRIALQERASFSPDALTGMEANVRFAGPETLETKIFGRLTAWQNWIFSRPNAAGPEGALGRYGTGQRASFDRRRV
jgi:benzoyl-CoA-dihydrodiol lyase